MRFASGLVAAFALIGTSPVMAGSCLPFLNYNAARLTLTTINKNGVVSYSSGYLNHVRSIVSHQVVIPEHWTSGTSGVPQQFSDRSVKDGLPNSQQAFDVGKSDLITLYITKEVSPTIKVTLKSWNNTTDTFVATCAPSGVMHGSVRDADYLLFMTDATIY